MSEQNSNLRGRTFLAGKIISSFGQSSIDCVIRRISDDGATIEVESVVGVPEHFLLLIANEGGPRPCKRVWQSDKQVGLVFETEDAVKRPPVQPDNTERKSGDSILRSQMLALRAALDEIDVGIVLLDSDLRAQFINRSFRHKWKLPDAVANRNPTFVALMYHGRDTKAYQVPTPKLDAYVAERVRLVRAGDTTPIDLRKSDGEVTRVQCAVLPNGGRMLSYATVTDIVRHADELELLRNALDNVTEGVVLLDAELNAQFVNRKMRQHFDVTDKQVAAHLPYGKLIANAPRAKDLGINPDDLDELFASRIAAVRAGNEPVRDLQIADGRHMRIHCSKLANGGRMLTYCDITDLVRNAAELEKMATTDSMTGLYNRRHFLAGAEAEWGRFQRYHRPLSMLMIDIDHFKHVNDRYGHGVGDETIIAVADACNEGKRGSDIVGRLGGEEFAMLLPETDLAQANIVAERLRKRICDRALMAEKIHFRVTASIGVAAASVSMSGVDILMRAADQALYQAKAEGRDRVVLSSPPSVPKLAAE